MKVIVRERETIDAALNRFSKKMSNSGVLKDLKERRYYKKKSEKKNQIKRKRNRDLKKNK